jgi:hypothetical protein
MVLFFLCAACPILEGKDSLLAKVTEKDYKGKISLTLYLLGVLLSFVSVWISGLLYFAVALLWIVPNTRIEKQIIK